MSLQIIETEENYRKISIENKEVTLTREDPHGLWFFHWDSGNVPDKLSGAFTNLGTAYEFLENYFVSLPKKKTNSRE